MKFNQKKRVGPISTDQNKKKVRRRILALSFFSPIALLCIAFAVIEIYPVGGNTMLIIDNYHQYTPFLMELGDMLRGGYSLLHSWNAGLGSNYLSRFAYYLSSPLNLFAVFVPDKLISEFTLVLVLLRAGLAGMTFSIYLRSKREDSGLRTVAFAVMYALCGFFLAYYWNIMWFDCVALLPLCILGLEQLVDQGKSMLYCITLAIVITSNYFIALLICIYLVLYFVVYYLSKPRRKLLPTIMRFAGFSLIAGALSAVVTIPAFFGLTASSNANFTFPATMRIYSEMIYVIANHFMMIKPAIMTGLPNIYCSLIVLALVPLYFLNKNIPFREKSGNAVLLAFFLISFNINYLDFLWHGTHFPNSLLFRFSFCYVFLVLTMSFQALMNLGGVKKRQILAAFMLMAGFLVFLEMHSDGDVSKLTVYISLIFCVLYGALLLPLKKYTDLSENGSEGMPQKSVDAMRVQTPLPVAQTDEVCNKSPEKRHHELLEQWRYKLPKKQRHALMDEQRFVLPEEMRFELPEELRYDIPDYDLEDAFCTEEPAADEYNKPDDDGIPNGGTDGADGAYNADDADVTDDAGEGDLGDDCLMRRLYTQHGIAQRQPQQTNADNISTESSEQRHSGNRVLNRRLGLEIALILAICLEVTINAGYGIGEAGIFPRDNYIAKLDSVKPAVELAKSWEQGFERMEFTEQNTYNTPVVYGYKGISYYSSTSYYSVNKLFGKLGFIDSNAWYVYRSSTPLINSIFSVRYLLNNGGNFNNTTYPLIEKVGDVGIYGNPYTLPVGFMVNQSVTGWNIEQTNPFLVHDDFVKRATGIDRSMYRRLALTEENTENISITEHNNGIYRYHRIADGNAVRATFSVTPEEDANVYLYVKSAKLDQVRVKKEGDTVSHSIRYPYIIDAQFVRAGELIEIDMTFEDGDSDTFTVYAYAFDEQGYPEIFERLNSQVLQVMSYTDTTLSGTINVVRPGMLFLSVPYDESWIIKVDDIEIKPKTIADDALMLIPLGSGSHRIEMKYLTKGFIPGLIISLSALALLVGGHYVKKRRGVPNVEVQAD